MIKMNKKRTKVCFFIGSFQAGGAENLLLQTLRCLDLERFSPHVAVFSKKGTLLPEFLKLDIPISEFPKKNLVSLMISFFKFICFLKIKKINVIHIHLVGCYVFAVFGSLLAGIKTRIIHWHNIYEPSRTKSWKVYLGSKLASRIVGVSKTVNRNNCRLYRISDSKVSLIYNAIDTHDIDNLKENKKLTEICIGSVGKLENQKGFDTLLRAFAIVNKVFPEACLEIIGQGPLQENLKELASELRIRHKVKFLGLLSNQDVLYRIGSWNVFVSTSLWEGLSIVLIEAMAMKKAIVATNIESNAEAVKDEVTGLLCPVDDAETIAKKIIWFLNNPGLAIEFGKRGKERLDSLFLLDVAMEKLYALYDQG